MCIGPMSGSGFPGKDEMRVSQVGFDSDELAILSMIRMFCQSFAQPESQAWMRGFQVAEAQYPQAQALQIAKATLVVLQAMRVVRRDGFRFSNPDCPNCARKLTENERQLMAAITTAREGRRSALHANAMVLCGGGETGSLIAAIGRLNMLLSEQEPQGELLH